MLRKFLVLVFFACFNSIVSSAQTEMPYSRYGLGMLQRSDPSFLRGWGALTAAYHNPYNINFANPASYGYLGFTVLEVGLYGSVMQLKTNDDSVGIFGDGGLANLSFAFPVIKNKLGVSTGIKPFSRVSYNILQNNDSVPGLGDTYNLFEGSGGLYEYYLGAGLRWKNLSFGINAAYLFGNIAYTTILAFPDTQNAYNTLREESRTLGDIVFNGGVQYRIPFGKEKNYFLDMGVSGNLKTNAKADRDLMYMRFTYSDNLSLTMDIKDTISSETDADGTIVLPASINAGIIFSKTSRFMIGINYQYTQWSDYLSFGENDQVNDSWRLSAGFQIIPDYKSYLQYWKLVAYRAGFSMGKNYLEFDKKTLPEYEISAGAGFPLKRVLSELSFAGEWTHIGDINDNPLTISNFRLTLGVTFDDRWFQKRKYD